MSRKRRNKLMQNSKMDIFSNNRNSDATSVSTTAQTVKVGKKRARSDKYGK